MNHPNDRYLAVIQQRDAWDAADWLADECRKKDMAIEVLEDALLKLVAAILRVEDVVPDSALNLGMYAAEVARAIELLGSERVKTAMGGLDTALEARP